MTKCAPHTWCTTPQNESSTRRPGCAALIYPSRPATAVSPVRSINRHSPALLTLSSLNERLAPVMVVNASKILNLMEIQPRKRQDVLLVFTTHTYTITAGCGCGIVGGRYWRHFLLGAHG
jgi:hypothetical protein